MAQDEHRKGNLPLAQNGIGDGEGVLQAVVKGNGGLPGVTLVIRQRIQGHIVPLLVQKVDKVLRVQLAAAALHLRRHGHMVEHIDIAGGLQMPEDIEHPLNVCLGLGIHSALLTYCPRA